MDLYKKEVRMRKMWEASKFLALLSVFPVCLLSYMYFVVAKYDKGDCISFNLHPEIVYSVTKKRLFRYELNDKLIVSINLTDEISKKVECSVKP